MAVERVLGLAGVWNQQRRQAHSRQSSAAAGEVESWRGGEGAWRCIGLLRVFCAAGGRSSGGAWRVRQGAAEVCLPAVERERVGEREFPNDLILETARALIA